jgi:hypothetical protein
MRNPIRDRRRGVALVSALCGALALVAADRHGGTDRAESGLAAL